MEWTECPDCGSEIYDNRAENAKREAAGKKAMPEWKCKANCGWLKWGPKKNGGSRKAAKAEPVSAVNIETLYEQSMGVATRRMVAAAKEHPTLGKPTWENVVAATATVFIQACRQGGLGDA